MRISVMASEINKHSTTKISRIMFVTYSIDSRTAINSISTLSTLQNIVAATPVQGVIARTTAQDVITATAVQCVVVRAGEQNIAEVSAGKVQEACVIRQI